jgi:hypothetical protein
MSTMRVLSLQISLTLVSHPAFPEIYRFLSASIQFFDALQLYETVFGRIPLSLLDERWVAQNISLHSRSVYDALKRAMDIVAAIILGAISLIFYPLSYLGYQAARWRADFL